MLTECWVRSTSSGQCSLAKSGDPRAVHHWARWRPVTVGAWRKVCLKDKDGRSPSGPRLESRAWSYLLEDTSLWGERSGPKHGPDGLLLPELFRAVLDHPHPFVAARLVRPVFAQTYITVEESLRIERECQDLWLSDTGRGLENPHPLLEEAVLAMMASEKFGIPAYGQVDQMPQRSWLAFRLVANTYGTVMELRRQKDDLRQEARRAAGMGGV